MRHHAKNLSPGAREIWIVLTPKDTSEMMAPKTASYGSNFKTLPRSLESICL
jgi:hypothetical protein